MDDNPDIVSSLQARMPPFSILLGIKFLSASPERLTAEMQTRITNEEGRLIAVVTQTQMVLEARTSA